MLPYQITGKDRKSEKMENWQFIEVINYRVRKSTYNDHFFNSPSFFKSFILFLPIDTISPSFHFLQQLHVKYGIILWSYCYSGNHKIHPNVIEIWSLPLTL